MRRFAPPPNARWRTGSGALPFRLILVVAFLAISAATATATGMARAAVASTPVVVTLTDAGVTLSSGSVPVGTVIFTVVNRGKIARDFEFSGRRTARLAPGKSSNLTVALTERGPMTFVSVGARSSRRLTGLLNVIDPCTNPVPTTVTIQMTQGNGLIVSQTTIPCGQVTFVVTDTGSQPDQLDIFELELATAKGSTPELRPAQTATVTLNFSVKGTVFVQSADYPPPEPEYGGDYEEISKLKIV